VGVLQLLLSDGRRAALSVTVHKMVVRTLLTLERAASGVVLAEWARAFEPRGKDGKGGLHPDVVVEILVSVCRAIFDNSAEDRWAWRGGGGGGVRAYGHRIGRAGYIQWFGGGSITCASLEN
jgi:hypothetical protein